MCRRRYSVSRLPLLIAPVAFLLFISARTVAAQQPTAAGDSLLAACVAATSSKDAAQADRLATAAERELRAARAAHPDDWRPLTLLARVQLQCRLPFGVGAGQGAIFGEAVELLEQAVAVDNANWQPRYTLALSLSRAPKFLGRDGQAIGQLEWLMVRLDSRTDVDELPSIYVMLGDLHARNGRESQARLVWTLGSRRFPADSVLADRVRATGVDATSADTSALRSPVAPPSLTTLTVSVAAPLARDGRSGRVVTALDVVTTPGGTADLLQAMQLLPGVTGGSESSDLSLRGGDPAESPVFVDGARLAYASKFESLSGGMFGVLDPSVLRSARLEAGGFSARYGDALSGVIVVETVGRPDGAITRAGLNSTGAGATLMRNYGTTGAWVTARVSDTEILLRTHGRTGDFATTPYSVDATAGVTRPVGSAEGRLVALVEADGAGRIVDAGGWRGSYDSRGQTAMLLTSLRGHGGVTQLGDWSITASANGRSGRTRFGALDRDRADGRAGVRAQGRWTLGDVLLFDAGVEGARLRETASGRVPLTAHYDPEAPSEPLDVPAREASHLGAWTEAQWAASPALTVSAGLRADRLPGEQSLTADPRASLSWAHGSWTSSLSGGVFHQGRWRAREDRPGRDADLGVARRARHLVAGVEHAGPYTLRVEAFRKVYDAVVGVGAEPTADHVTVSGADILVRPPKLGRVAWWATYSWLRSRTSLVNGGTVPSALDVTHSLAVVGRLAFGRGWELGSTLRLATGRPFTPVVGGLATDNGMVPIPGLLHGERYPTYGRLDARLTRSTAVGNGLLLLYLEALNLTNRENVATYSYDDAFRTRAAVPYFFSQRTLVLGMEARF